MNYVISRVLKWLFSMTLIMIGIRFLMMASDNNDVRPIIICIFSFGAVYVMYRTRSEVPKMIGLLTAIVFVGAMLAARYLYIDLPVFNYGFYFAWWAWIMALGLPVMLLGFSRFGGG